MAIDKIDVTKGITGVLPTANLGSGTASSSTVLYGDQTYKTAPSGSHVKLVSGNASSSVNHDFQSFMDTSKYHSYMVQFSNLLGQQGNAMDFQFLDGSSASEAGYNYSVQGMRSSGTSYATSGESASQGPLGTGLDGSSDHGNSYLFWIYNNPNSTEDGSSVYGHNWGWRADYSDYIFTDYQIVFKNNNSCDGFRVHATGNDATTFSYAIFGIIK